MKTLGSLILSALLFITVTTMALDVPRLVAYQGLLTDPSGTPLTDGAHVIQFRIWDDPAATAPANEKWWSGVTSVTTANGLFDILLGNPAMNPIDPGIFADSNLWLGVAVGADPELAPRTKLTTAPYAFTARAAMVAAEAEHAAIADALTTPLDHGALTGLADDDHRQYVHEAGDYMYGSLEVGDGVDTWASINSFAGGFYQRGVDGADNAYMHGNNWGQIALFDGQAVNRKTVEINANFSTGGELILWSAAGAQTHRLDAGNTGNTSVTFPNDAISADETMEEAGIARSWDSYTALNDGNIVNVTSTTITVPGPGYIVARGYGYAGLSGTTLGNALVYIATSATGASTGSDNAAFGYNDQAFGSYQNRWGNLSCERTFAVGAAGSYTYYLNGIQGYIQGTANVYDAKLLLTYFPTNYGTVSTIAANSDIGQFEGVTAIETATSSVKGEARQVTIYSVDLQELVNKAKLARLAAEKAELELQIALQKQQPASTASDVNTKDK